MKSKNRKTCSISSAINFAADILAVAGSALGIRYSNNVVDMKGPAERLLKALMRKDMIAPFVGQGKRILINKNSEKTYWIF